MERWTTDSDNSIFLNVLNALQILREKEDLSPDCPPFNTKRSRWHIVKTWRHRRPRMDGMVKVGDDCGDGIDVPQQGLIEAIMALNNFIHERREL